MTVAGTVTTVRISTRYGSQLESIPPQEPVESVEQVPRDRLWALLGRAGEASLALHHTGSRGPVMTGPTGQRHEARPSPRPMLLFLVVERGVDLGDLLGLEGGEIGRLAVDGRAAEGQIHIEEPRSVAVRADLLERSQ